jgi:folate-binding protein YgfZ
MVRSALGADAGASIDVDGWTIAAVYDDPAREYAALRDDAALVDLAFHDRVRATGDDRTTFLQGMLSNDVARLGAGEGCPALLLTEQGRVVADPVVLALDDAFLLDARASAVAAMVAALARYIVADDVELTRDDDTHAVGVFGPRAAETLARLHVAPLPAVEYGHTVGANGASPMRVVRVPCPGAGGFLCFVPRAAVVDWWTSASRAGVTRAGWTAFESVRIESGLPAYGVDIGGDTIALEAPLDAAISFGKGCYLGQEVIERVTARGHVNRKLVGLVVDGVVIPAAGDTIAAGGKEIGRVTSAAWSWRLDRPVALGYVRREQIAPGTRLELSTAGGAAATVHALPIV